MTQKKRVNYLNNADLLYEINKSKMSYSYMVNNKYEEYDIIVPTVNDITFDIFNSAKEARAKRLNLNTIRDLKKSGMTLKTALKHMHENKIYIDASDINISDVVFRVMTDEHIPELKPKEKTLFRSEEHTSELQ